MLLALIDCLPDTESLLESSCYLAWTGQVLSPMSTGTGPSSYDAGTSHGGTWLQFPASAPDASYPLRKAVVMTRVFGACHPHGRPGLRPWLREPFPHVAGI